MLDWLFSKQIRQLTNEKDAITERVEQLEAKLSEAQEMMNEYSTLLRSNSVRRLTLDDLKITKEQRILLRNAGSQFRQALFDLGEHVCLTEQKECCRNTAVKFRNYYMQETRGKDNEIPWDKTAIDKINERRNSFFTKNVYS